MAQVTGQQTAADRLARLGERVRDWRSTRVRRSPMPAILWEEAVRLGQQLGVHPVKAALGLNYESLRQRVADAAKSGSSAPRYIELRDGIHLSTVAEAAIGSVVEITEPGGLRLRVRSPPLSVRDLSESRNSSRPSAVPPMIQITPADSGSRRRRGRRLQARYRRAREDVSGVAGFGGGLEVVRSRRFR